ncbi:MAG: ABC transporter ATP-binding protein [Gammaproteobacteria bacterium]|nr:ABC transporter ATP-binding protein [Gammaproteobacteria bacterium]
MSEPLLSVRNLKVGFGSLNGASHTPILDGLNFDIYRGETFALLGESGCGKSMTALSLMGLLPEGGQASGAVQFDGIALFELPEVGLRRLRGQKMAMIFQEPMTSLNPVLSIGEQIIESVIQHQKMKRTAAIQHSIELLDAVGIPDPKSKISEYPHQLSGGMKQRVMIALALAGSPDLLIADEPTTALDVTIQAQVLSLLQDLQKQTDMSILLITHDLGVVAGMADRIAVVYAGQLVEVATRDQFFSRPRHPYSVRLFETLPELKKRNKPLQTIEGVVPRNLQCISGCRFAARCDLSWDLCGAQQPEMMDCGEGHSARCFLVQETPQKPISIPQQAKLGNVAEEKVVPMAKDLLAVKNLKVHFPIQKGLLKRTVGHVYAVDDVSFEIPVGHTMALVGESGCGKTTVGKGILQLLPVTQGKVFFKGEDLTALSPAQLRQRRHLFQIIFQDPFSSMNPRLLVGDILREGMEACGIGNSVEDRNHRVIELLQAVGLPEDALLRYPHEFSGGQRQRICIARALAVSPELIICDEPTSALDVSVQAQILNLLKKLQKEFSISYLFITHNVSVVAYLADEVAVMYLGRIIEKGPVEKVLTAPAHPYTQALMAAVPDIHSEKLPQVKMGEGDLPSPSDPPSGCYFHPRCPLADEVCKQSYPEKSQVSENHLVHCFRCQ